MILVTLVDIPNNVSGKGLRLHSKRWHSHQARSHPLPINNQNLRINLHSRLARYTSDILPDIIEIVEESRVEGNLGPSGSLPSGELSRAVGGSGGDEWERESEGGEEG